MNLELLKNKHVQLALGISLGILVLILLFSPHPAGPASRDDSRALPSPYRPELQSVGDVRRLEASNYRRSVQDQLPIYQDDIQTSVGITTTLNLYFLGSDPPEIVRFEIYGVSYLGRDNSEFTNKNITAFKETFTTGLTLLQDQGIDPTKLIFIYGDKQYVRDTATAWVIKYKLLP